MNYMTKLLPYLLIIVCLMTVFADDKYTGRFTLEEPLSREKSMVVFIKFGNGYMNLGPADQKTAFEGEFYYKEYKPDVRYEVVGNEGRLDIRFSGDVRDDEEGIRTMRVLAENIIWTSEKFKASKRRKLKK